MKATRTLALLLGMIATLAIFSCKKADLVNTQPSEDASKKSGIVIVREPHDVDPGDCWSTCINPEGPYIRASNHKTQNWGNTSNPHWKTVNSFAYNTATSFVVEVTFTHSGGNSSNTVSVTALGSTQSIATLASGATHTFTFALPADWNACDNVPFSIYQEGQNSPMNMSCSYNLFGICVADDACETSFTGEAIACGNQREAVYTFTSQDAQTYVKIQGGLTNFTGADAEVSVTGGTGMSTSQWTPGGSTNRVIKVEGSVGACETITVRIRWNSTNSGGVITGSWSVKDANGVEVAPEVAGLTCN